MEVILLESFDRSGQIGDIVNVKNGFARNFLIPNKKAIYVFNEDNISDKYDLKYNIIPVLDKNKKVISIELNKIRLFF